MYKTCSRRTYRSRRSVSQWDPLETSVVFWNAAGPYYYNDVVQLKCLRVHSRRKDPVDSRSLRKDNCNDIIIVYIHCSLYCTVVAYRPCIGAALAEDHRQRGILSSSVGFSHSSYNRWIQRCCYGIVIEISRYAFCVGTQPLESYIHDPCSRLSS